MWRTPEGERVLKGAERTVFLTAVADLATDMQDCGDGHTTGVGKFDRFSFGQRAALLEDVTAALADPKIPVPTHTAANEAAIYAIFHHMKAMIDIELDLSEQPEFRTLLADAGRECAIEDVLSPTDERTEEWGYCIDALRDRILWDHDFSDEDIFIDAASEHGTEGSIPYFTSIVRDPKDSEIPGCFDRVFRLANG